MADHFKKIGRMAGCPASINESAVNGWTDVFTVKASDIADASLTTKGDSVSLQLCKIPTGYAVKGVALNVKKAFTVEGGTLTASVGDSSDAVALVAAQDIKTAGIKAPTAGFVPAKATGGTVSEVVLKIATEASKGSPSGIADGELKVYLQVVSCG